MAMRNRTRAEIDAISEALRRQGATPTQIYRYLEFLGPTSQPLAGAHMAGRMNEPVMPARGYPRNDELRRRYHA